MVYLGSIFKSHEKMGEDDRILLKFGNGDEISIFKDDILEKQNGDLKITRRTPMEQIIYVDTAFVKFVIISKRFL